MLWLLLFLVPPLVLLPSIGQFYYAPGSSFSDLAISHYPNALFLLNAIKTGQGFPWWSPSILSGYPFAADPLSGLWYPPGLLALLLPLPQSQHDCRSQRNFFMNLTRSTSPLQHFVLASSR